MMEIDGYMIRVRWDGSVLRVKPSNKMSRTALLGADPSNELVLPREEIVDIAFRDANPFINGNLTIRAADGRKYQLHFRRKHRADFARLLDALKETAVTTD